MVRQWLVKGWMVGWLNGWLNVEVFSYHQAILTPELLKLRHRRLSSARMPATISTGSTLKNEGNSCSGSGDIDSAGDGACNVTRVGGGEVTGTEPAFVSPVHNLAVSLLAGADGSESEGDLDLDDSKHEDRASHQPHHHNSRREITGKEKTE
jgi:hypothetical protein